MNREMKEILILRCVSFQQLDRVLKATARRFSDPRLSVLCHAHNSERLAHNPRVHKLYFQEHTGDFTFRRLPDCLKKRNFDRVIVPLSNPSGAGFLNVLLLSLRIKSTRRCTCNLLLQFSDYTSFSVCTRLLAAGLYSFLAALLTGITFIPSILTAMVCKQWKGITARRRHSPGKR